MLNVLYKKGLVDYSLYFSYIVIHCEKINLSLCHIIQYSAMKDYVWLIFPF